MQQPPQFSDIVSGDNFEQLDLITPEDIPSDWNSDLWIKVWTIANRMSRQELIVAWLEGMVNTFPDDAFNQNLHHMQSLTKEEILGFLDEMGQENAPKFIKRYGQYLKQEPKS